MYANVFLIGGKPFITSVRWQSAKDARHHRDKTFPCIGVIRFKEAANG